MTSSRPQARISREIQGWEASDDVRPEGALSKEGASPTLHIVDEIPRPNAVADVLDRFVSGDGKRRVEVWRRNDGFFGFSEEEELDDEYSGLYWSPIRGSGLYETREDALRDARAEIPWLRDS